MLLWPHPIICVSCRVPIHPYKLDRCAGGRRLPGGCVCLCNTLGYSIACEAGEQSDVSGNLDLSAEARYEQVDKS